MVNIFSINTKKELLSINTKNECCKKSLLFGMLSFSNLDEEGIITFISENDDVVSLYEKMLLDVFGGTCDISYYGKGLKLTICDEPTLISIYNSFDIRKFDTKVFCCDNCKKSYLRGAFLVAGTIISPDNSYRLEIKCPRYMKIQNDILKEFDIKFSVLNRRSLSIFYLKSSEKIQDFLYYIGATHASFDFVNKKIEKEYKNSLNRIINFEVANIKKATANANNQAKQIQSLFTSGTIQTISEDLKETAQLRVDNPDLSLSDLAALHNPPITKSGLNHRLKKLLELSNK